jgi:hypothetical protein
MRDTIGRAEFFLVRTARLGDVPFENDAQVAPERWTVGIDRKNSDTLSARLVNAFRHNRTPNTLRTNLSVELPDYDPGHLSLSLNPR